MSSKEEQKCPKFLWQIFSVAFSRAKFKTKTEQDVRPAVGTATTQNTPVLSTVFNISPVVYQLLQFNDGSLTAITDDLLQVVSVCGKQNYLQNRTVTGKFDFSLSRNPKLFPLIASN